MYKKILIGVDGSDSSMNALKHAINLAVIHKSKLHIISVLEEFKLPFASQYELWASESRDKYITQVLEEMNSALINIKKDDAKLDIETRIEEGRPAIVITKVAEKENFDLIIIGASGIGKVEEFILGSTSREIIDISKVPVLILK
jgi:nucleotide-binding universal stress UspA family protein